MLAELMGCDFSRKNKNLKAIHNDELLPTDKGGVATSHAKIRI